MAYAEISAALSSIKTASDIAKLIKENPWCIMRC